MTDSTSKLLNKLTRGGQAPLLPGPAGGGAQPGRNAAGAPEPPGTVPRRLDTHGEY